MPAVSGVLSGAARVCVRQPRHHRRHRARLPTPPSSSAPGFDALPCILQLFIGPYQWWSEALHGVAYSPGVTFGNSLPGATSFPQVATTAMAWNRTLWAAIGTTVGTEARVFNNLGQAGLTFWTPNINIFRGAQWGRGQETPGEVRAACERAGRERRVCVGVRAPRVTGGLLPTCRTRPTLIQSTLRATAPTHPPPRIHHDQNDVDDHHDADDADCRLQDPYVNGQYAAAYISNLQTGDDPRYLRISSCSKHYAAYRCVGDGGALSEWRLR